MPKSPADIDHLSHNSVSTYLRCPRQWAYSYLEELPRGKPSMSLLRGIAVDRAATANLRQKVRSHEDMATVTVKEIAEDQLRQDVANAGGQHQVDWEGSSYPRAIDSATGLAGIHMLHHAPSIQPALVQHEMHRKLPGGRDFVGYLDFVEESGAVGDIKTGARRMGQDAADRDQQASAYGFLVGGDVEMSFWRVVDSGTRRYEEVVTTKRPAAAGAWYRDAAQAVSNAIDAAAFPPNPTGWWCSPKRCAFWQRCQVEQRPPEFPLEVISRVAPDTSEKDT